MFIGYLLAFQLIITESAPPPRPISVETTLTTLDENESPTPDITKTYYITYTYLNTFLEKDSIVIKTNVATSTDYVLEKAPKITSIKSIPVNQTPDPIQIYATKTYLTTFTYFTTVLQVLILNFIPLTRKPFCEIIFALFLNFNKYKIPVLNYFENNISTFYFDYVSNKEKFEQSAL